MSWILAKFVTRILKFVMTEVSDHTGRFIMLYVITNICNKKTKGPTLMELFTATGKLKKFCVPCHPWCTHRTSLVVKKKLFQFSCGCEQFHEGRSFLSLL
jgi:hypothetical protein